MTPGIFRFPARTLTAPRRSRRDSGQALIFGAITFFMIVAAIALVVNVGQSVNTKIRLQNAADSAAYGGALIEGNCVSSVGWVNDGMALVYYHLMRYAVDTSVHATLAHMKEHGPPFPDDGVVGLPNAVAEYDAAWQKADEWIPKGERWLTMLAQMERVVALITPVLVEKETYDVAKANGAKKAALFPKFQMFPDPEGYVRVYIEKLANGWRLTSSTGMTVEAVQTGDESWHIEMEQGVSKTTVDITKTSPEQFIIEYDDGTTQETIQIDRTKVGDIIIKGSGATVTNNPDGTTTICEGSKCVSVRKGPNGPQTNDGSGWKDLPRTDSVDVGGSQVRVDNFDQGIHVGNNATVYPDHINIGNTTIYYTNPIRIITHFGPVAVRVDEDYAVANGLSTKRADCKWRRLWNDRTRHRMCQESATSWIYEFQKNASYMLPDSPERYTVTHAMHDNDDVWKATNQLPEWALKTDPVTGEVSGWFDPRAGKSPDPMLYHQTRPCWHPSDLVCPLHGKSDTDDPKEPNGYWHDPAGNVVECPICHGQDNDGDGFMDVRIHQSDTYVRKGRPTLDAADRQSVDLLRLEMPLVLTEDFFKFGINVAVWNAHPGAPVLNALYKAPSWGYYAVASAKVGFYDYETGEYRYAFDDPDERKDWVENSFANLYEPTWAVKLIPVRTAVKSEDIEADTAVDSGTNYLFRSIAATEWREDYFARDERSGRNLRHMPSPRNGRNFDLSGKELEDALHH
ncbi:MAG: Tad domain-containing protein [Planctomycetota bacterium]